MNGRVVLRTLAIIGAIAALVGWEILVVIFVKVSGWDPSPFELVLVGKTGFAALLVLILTATRFWRAGGFAGPLALRHWWKLWPLWLAAAASLTQLKATPWWIDVIGWTVIAAAIGFGEEGVFRGIVLANLTPERRPRAAVLVSAILFGLVHLAGLAAPIDPRMILGQVFIAFALGLTLGAMRLQTRSIWPGIAAHTALDATGLIAAGGLGEALDYSTGAITYMLVAGVIASLWGLVLMWRLKPVEG